MHGQVILPISFDMMDAVQRTEEKITIGSKDFKNVHYLSLLHSNVFLA